MSQSMTQVGATPMTVRVVTVLHGSAPVRHAFCEAARRNSKFCPTSLGWITYVLTPAGTGTVDTGTVGVAEFRSNTLSMRTAEGGQPDGSVTVVVTVWPTDGLLGTIDQPNEHAVDGVTIRSV